MFIYTQSQLQQAMNRGIQGREGLLVDPQETMNEGVRELYTEIRLRSARRRNSLTPNLLNGEFEYAAPSDLEGPMLLDIQTNERRSYGELTLVPTEQFNRTSRDRDIAIGDYNGIRTLLARLGIQDSSTSVDPLSIAGTAAWRLFGTAEDVVSTTDDSIKNGVSIQFDLGSTSGTTAGIYNDDLGALDLSQFILHQANVFTYARITSATNLTNYKLRLGTDSSNYYEFTVTTRNDGTALSAGWNLLRFDLLAPTTTGSPDVYDINYAALFMTKTTGKINESGYMFNWLEARKGKYADVLYYSKYGWQSSAGAYKENSTDPLDVLVADTDEYDLIVKKVRCVAANEADLSESQIARLTKQYADAAANYILKNPSEDKTSTSRYYDYDFPETHTDLSARPPGWWD